MALLILLLILGIFVGCGGGSSGELATPGANTALEQGTSPGDVVKTNGAATVTVGQASPGELTTPGANIALEQGTSPGDVVKTNGAATVTEGQASPGELTTPGANTALEQGKSPGDAAKTNSAATVTVGNASFAVELAATPAQRAQGLSGRSPLATGTGMLFVFEEERRHSFWMKDMRFPLDILWIDSQCVLADITENAPKPEPDQALNDLPTFAPAAPVKYVLEVNGGIARQAGVRRGDRVTFTGSLAGRFGC